MFYAEPELWITTLPRQRSQNTGGSRESCPRSLRRDATKSASSYISAQVVQQVDIQEPPVEQGGAVKGGPAHPLLRPPGSPLLSGDTQETY